MVEAVYNRNPQEKVATAMNYQYFIRSREHIRKGENDEEETWLTVDVEN